MPSPAQQAFKLAYEIAPITLVGGSAQSLLGGLLPALTLLEQVASAISGEGLPSLDLAFANFMPIPGGSIIANQAATYPFANLATAANALLAQPLMISMRMTCPARGAGAMLSRPAILQALKSTLKDHCANGGLFHVATPAIFYDYCMLLDVVDVTSEGAQAQAMWRWDFTKPLVTQQDAAQVQNTLMNKLDSGAMTDGATSGADLADAQNAQGGPTTADGSATGGAGIGGNDVPLPVPRPANIGDGGVGPGPGGGNGFGFSGAGNGDDATGALVAGGSSA